MSTTDEPITTRTASGPSASPYVAAVHDYIHAHTTDDAGDVTTCGVWAGRIGRRVALVDEYGFRSVHTFATDDAAAAFIGRVAEYEADMGEGAA